ncbi:MAG: HDOD domain-containing protein [Gammaproteobacteria bacterium]|jgi:HD-like signal output (HDOD) protein|nr:HDOD domain-containing protein [Gammaproteobacteria bacterium]MBU0772390.1 HDOD domain-containing protein [Gammaproteobacteria bacterium]MBU0854935.1 HDOD domain-containing protein [Gammaproteobacteria bacterium]MBU1845669.1 HDOD domain-containing protein [Gammaproteobacteria bacterium]
MNVVFVDDEERVLAGIERALSMNDAGWTCRFFTRGRDALAALNDCPADVVVSDMRMPFMDGAQLLASVRRRWPATLRIILSGQSDPDATLRMLEVAHQFVAKPCDNARLLSTVENALSLRTMFIDPSVVDVVGRVNHLPAAPAVFAELTRLIADPASDGRDIARLLGSDPALSAKVMQLANSAYFGGGGTIRSIADAITRLGIDQVRVLVLASEVFANATVDPFVDQLQRTSLMASTLAGRLTTGKRGEAETAALLARIGLLIPDLREDTLLDARTDCDTPLQAAVGAYLLGLWGLPMGIVEAVARHLQPARATEPGFGLTGVVHVAVALANATEPDTEYLAGAGVLDQWPHWQSMHEGTRLEDSHD